jgi:hypothetical protein
VSEQHSPAPWRLNWKVAGGGQHEGIPTLHYVCVESANINTADDPLRLVGYMRPSDARLIAVAPDLLALAHQYARECGDCSGTRITPDGNGGNEPCTECADIWLIIDKAEGRT